MRETRNAYYILVRKLRHRRKWEVDVKMDVTEIGYFCSGFGGSG
jgi:hypothetical protein